MRRRYAILDDNQQALEERLSWLQSALPPLVRDRVAAVMVIGSVAQGRARDLSDIDLVMVLRDERPTREHYRWWDHTVSEQVASGARYPIQPLFVARTALDTDEPHLRTALAAGFHLWDPEHIFHDESESRA